MLWILIRIYNGNRSPLPYSPEITIVLFPYLKKKKKRKKKGSSVPKNLNIFKYFFLRSQKLFFPVPLIFSLFSLDRSHCSSTSRASKMAFTANLLAF